MKVRALFFIEAVPGLTLYGQDDKDLIVVLETESSREMEEIVKGLYQIEGVLNVSLTYLNVEDED